MKQAILSPHPHFTWLGFNLHVPAGVSLCFCRRAHNFSISIVLSGKRFARWIHCGHEVQWTGAAGAVHFIPADDERHTVLMKSDHGCHVHKFLIPRDQLNAWADSEGVDCPVEWKRIAADDDPVLRMCMTQLATAASAGCESQCLGEDEAAHRLFFRLVELNGGRAPDWWRDTSVFDERTLQHFRTYIDNHLRIMPSLTEMSALSGLSPSHFSRKFRHSAGISLCRFVNMRRLQAALDLLKEDSTPLAQMALDLGFSSQSHFTRLFSEMTGMTPAKYRKANKAVVG